MMIRNDALPSVQSVIVSNLDLQDLSRNQVLDSWDEAQAGKIAYVFIELIRWRE